MLHHSALTDRQVRQYIKQKRIGLGGNAKLKIYGALSCASGKRMKKENRVFFVSEKEAMDLGFRPCGHCMKQRYQIWKNGSL